jgi:hypothetical protein
MWKWNRKRTRTIVYELNPDPAPLYQDVLALGSLGAAVQAAALKQGLEVPVEAFLPLGLDFCLPHPLYGLIVQSGIPGRESLSVVASTHTRTRSWRIQGCEANQRIEGTTRELAEVALVTHEWRARTALTDIRRMAPFVELHTVDYRYLGVVHRGDTPDEPSVLLRVWTDANGYQREETFMASLTWEPTHVTSPIARPTYDPDPVEVDAATADRFLHRRIEYVNSKRHLK